VQAQEQMLPDTERDKQRQVKNSQEK